MIKILNIFDHFSEVFKKKVDALIFHVCIKIFSSTKNPVEVFGYRILLLVSYSGHFSISNFLIVNKTAKNNVKYL